MEDKASVEGTSSSQLCDETSESSVEINIKTLDSQIYTFRVDKNMPVLMLKEKIAGATGIAVGQQRLIYRGKVLKDDHCLSEYHLEDGHTLHLVERQPVQTQPTLGTSSQEIVQNNVGQGNDSTVPPNRVGQVSHGGVLGTVNVADQGGTIVADIGRLVGAVLSSLGIGASSISTAATTTNQVLGSVAQNAGGRVQTSNPGQPGVTILNNSVQFIPQITQSPPVTLTRPAVIPDSLTTLSEFISRMDSALQIAGARPSPPPANAREPPRSDIPGVPTPEVLGSVIERVEQLLSGNTSAALSRIAACLERERTSTDPVIRSQIQAEAMHVGTAMQHLGAMLLELGRATMTLRMGQSPAEAWVNAGPAIYISSTGPNPIMVQPLPLQTSSIISGPTLVSGLSAPFGTVDPSRNVNIHIHNGTSVTSGPSAAGPRAISVEDIRGERPNAEQASTNGSGFVDSTPTRALPSRTVVAAIPARSAAETTSHVLSLFLPVQVRTQLSVPGHVGSTQGSSASSNSEAQPNTSSPIPNPSESDTIPTLITQINAHIASALAGSALGESSTSVGTQFAGFQGSQPTMSSGGQSSTVGQSQEFPPAADMFATPGTAQGQNSANVPCASRAIEETDIISTGSTLSSNVNNYASCQVQNMADVRDGESYECLVTGLPESEGRQVQSEASRNSGNVGYSKSLGEETATATTCSAGTAANSRSLGEETAAASTCPTGTAAISLAGGEPSSKSMGESIERSPLSPPAPASQPSRGLRETDRPAPLGLGLGGLQSKSQGKAAKPAAKVDLSREMPPTSQNQQSIARGRHVLQSLVPQSSETNRPSGNSSSAPLSMAGQGDIGSMMSQILQSPAMNGILAGLSEQAGVGSPANLRNMLEQCTQSLGMNNILNNFVQQFEGQGPDFESMLLRSGREGSIDFSSMIQQMIPVVSQAFGRESAHSTPLHRSEHQSHGTDASIHGDYMLRKSENYVAKISDGLAGGPAEQVDIDSPADLKSISEGTQNPAMGDILNDIPQQVEAESQNFGCSLLGMGRGQDGIDLSRMIQQMMPVMSQVLGRGSIHSATAQDVESHPLPGGNDGRADGHDVLGSCEAQVDMQQVVETIEQQDSIGDVFRAELESAVRLDSEGNQYGNFVEELSNNAELIDEFKEMFQNHIHHKLQAQSKSKGNP